MHQSRTNASRFVHEVNVLLATASKDRGPMASARNGTIAGSNFHLRCFPTVWTGQPRTCCPISSALPKAIGQGRALLPFNYLSGEDHA